MTDPPNQLDDELNTLLAHVLLEVQNSGIDFADRPSTYASVTLAKAQQRIRQLIGKELVAELEQHIDWVQRLHAEPENFEDRWSVAAMEIVAKGRERIEQIKKEYNLDGR